MPTPEALEAARRLAVERSLAALAFRHLTVDAFMALPFEALGPTKALLKRFFSAEPWGRAEAEALAEVVGPGEGVWERPLDGDLTLHYGWEDGRFAVRITSAAPPPSASEPPQSSPPDDDPLAGTFDGPVVPEATPNPRTVRFRTGTIHEGPSRWYASASSASGDAGATRLFAEFDEVANVLVGPDFVAVSLRRPADWERLLHRVLAVVTGEFVSTAGAGARDSDDDTARVTGGPAGAGTGPVESPTVDSRRRVSRLEQAWLELGSLRPADPTDLARLRKAATSDNPAHRQVAANLFREAPQDVAAAAWARLVVDRVRSVRRASVDAMVDVERQELRALLETALADTDPWARWKALRGLAELGPEPSREAIAAHADDPDFRVRLEAAAALRACG